MKKKLIRIAVILIILLLAITIIAKIDTMKQTKENAIEQGERLIDAIRSNNYDDIRKHVKNMDGQDLSNEQIDNFLLNTNLFRILSISGDEEIKVFNTSSKASFLNHNEGSVLFSFQAVDGDVFTNEIKYIRNGAHEYLVTDRIETSNKQKVKYYMASDLANGKYINFEENEEDASELERILGGYGIDEKGNRYFEILEDSIDDIKINTLNALADARNSLKKVNNNYNIEWNDDYKVFSIYYEESIETNKPMTYLEAYSMCYYTSELMQCLSGNENWRLTIDFYDYNTKELIKTETIR